MSKFGIKDCEFKMFNRDTGEVVLSGDTHYLNSQDYNNGYNKGYKEGKEDTTRELNSSILTLVSGLRDLKDIYKEIDGDCLCDSYYDDINEVEVLCPYCTALELIKKYSL